MRLPPMPTLDPEVPQPLADILPELLTLLEARWADNEAETTTSMSSEQRLMEVAAAT